MVFTAYVKDKNGKEDSDIGAVSLIGLKGEAYANAIMKAATKSKRRVTLSISGLGLLDESEVDSIPGAKIEPIDLSQQSQNQIEGIKNKLNGSSPQEPTPTVVVPTKALSETPPPVPAAAKAQAKAQAAKKTKPIEAVVVKAPEPEPEAAPIELGETVVFSGPHKG